MSVQTTIVSEAELAKTTVMNSPLDDDTKRNLITLISRSALATNGITPEEKIQSLTECMATLAAVLGTYMSKSESRLAKIEANHDVEHPGNKLDRLQKYEQELSDIEEYRNMNGITPNIRINGMSLADKIKTDGNVDDSNTLIDKTLDILHKPYAWIFGSIAVCSPYANDVIQTIINACK